MYKSFKKTHLLFLVLSLFLLPSGCDRLTWDNDEDRETIYSEEEEEDYFYELYTPKQIDSLVEVGRALAVKKARQMTDLKFIPLSPIDYNIGTYEAGKEYTGLIYSSVKELGTYVGTDVSFHTFMTAINNPHSLLYTEKIDEYPYYGVNCRAYYGTVCSNLVSYALGLYPPYSGVDFTASSLMNNIHNCPIDSIHVADILWRPSHVALITDIDYNNDGSVNSVEISEAVQSGSRRRWYSRDSFSNVLNVGYDHVIRYLKLYRNQDYIPQPQFVSVFDEISVPFLYNETLSIDKGDQSNYLIGESVVINLLKNNCKKIRVLHNNNAYAEYDPKYSMEIVLKRLPWGNYEAIAELDNGSVEKVSWIVVDYTVRTDARKGLVYFSSLNAIPEVFKFCDQSGSRSYPFTQLYCHSFTQDEVGRGVAQIPSNKTKAGMSYYKITFKTVYGRATLRPQRWE